MLPPKPNHMNEPIQVDRLLEFLRGALRSGTIDRVEYHVTGWSLRVQAEREWDLHAAEIKTAAQAVWQEALKEPPFSLKDGNEPEDTAVAVALFNVVNSFPILDLDLLSDGSLVLDFAEGRALTLSGVVEQVDWTWQLDAGGTNMVTCDSGTLFAHHDVVRAR